MDRLSNPLAPTSTWCCRGMFKYLSDLTQSNEWVIPFIATLCFCYRRCVTGISRSSKNSFHGQTISLVELSRSPIQLDITWAGSCFTLLRHQTVSPNYLETNRKSCSMALRNSSHIQVLFQLLSTLHLAPPLIHVFFKYILEVRISYILEVFISTTV